MVMKLPAEGPAREWVTAAVIVFLAACVLFIALMLSTRMR